MRGPGDWSRGSSLPFLESPRISIFNVKSQVVYAPTTEQHPFPVTSRLNNEKSWLSELKAQKSSQSHGKWIMAVNETISSSYSIHYYQE